MFICFWAIWMGCWATIVSIFETIQPYRHLKPLYSCIKQTLIWDGWVSSTRQIASIIDCLTYLLLVILRPVSAKKVKSWWRIGNRTLCWCSFTRGVVLSPAVIPIGLTVTWRKLTGAGIIAGALIGATLGASWALTSFIQRSLTILMFPYERHVGMDDWMLENIRYAVQAQHIFRERSWLSLGRSYQHPKPSRAVLRRVQWIDGATLFRNHNRCRILNELSRPLLRAMLPRTQILPLPM